MERAAPEIVRILIGQAQCGDRSIEAAKYVLERIAPSRRGRLVEIEGFPRFKRRWTSQLRWLAYPGHERSPFCHKIIDLDLYPCRRLCNGLRRDIFGKVGISVVHQLRHELP